MDLIKITALDQLEKYEIEWSSILEKVDNTNPFIEYEWLYEWWRFLGKENNIEIIAVKEQNQFLAFFPFMYTKKGFVYEYNFMALGQANYMDVVAVESVLDRAIEFVFDYLIENRKKVLFNLHGLLESSKTPHSIESYLRKKGIDNRNYRIVTPFVDLDTIHLDEYMKERKTLHGLDRREKRLKALGTVKLETSHAEEMDHIFFLHQKRWEKKNDTSGFTDEKRRNFYRRLAENTAGVMRVQIESLYLENRLIAFTYGFKCRGRYMGYVLGHDNNFDFFSPGRILVKEKIKKSVQSSTKILDMSIGYEPYKFEWNTGLDHTRRMVFSSKSKQAQWIRNSIWLKERMLAGIKKQRRAVLFRRNTVGKIKYILRNLKSFETFQKVKPDLVKIGKDILRFGYDRRRHVVMKMDINPIATTGRVYKEMTIEKVFNTTEIEDRQMKEIGEKLYQGFTGFYEEEPFSLQNLFWINCNVIRIDSISYLSQLRKRTAYIERWKMENIMDICAFMKEEYQMNTILIELKNPSKGTVAELKSMGFSTDKIVYNRTYLGKRISRIISMER